MLSTGTNAEAAKHPHLCVLGFEQTSLNQDTLMKEREQKDGILGTVHARRKNRILIFQMSAPSRIRGKEGRWEGWYCLVLRALVPAILLP